MRSAGSLAHFVKQILPVPVFSFLALFTYAYFFQLPYGGFEFSRGEIVDVFVNNSLGADLQVGDQLVQVGPVLWAHFTRDTRLTLFNDVTRGDVVPLVVQREGEIIPIPWTFPGFNRAEFLDRLNSAWWLPYAFWVLGTITYLFIRPRDIRWQLLVAFNFLTAIWLSAGSGPSHWHLWGSSIILPATIWISWPVYWHFHWIFPKPLGRLPRPVIWGGYFIAAVLAFSELFQILPANLYLAGFILAIAGSLALLILHGIRQPGQRRELRIILRIAAFVILPIIAVSIAGLYGSDLRLVTLLLLGLPLIPAAYIYTIYRQHLGELEIRANRQIALYLYLILLGTAVLIVATFAVQLLGLTETHIFVALATAVIVGLTAILTFAGFTRFVEHRILGMPLPPAFLLESYATQITAQLDKASLVTLLKGHVLSSLLVRRSAIVYWEQNQIPQTLFRFNVEKQELPSAEEVSTLLAQTGRYRATNSEAGPPSPCPWAYLVLPLNLGNKSIGLWLLGSRDPDDLYSQGEIPTLKALAAQTAVALTNILQAENLHQLYQSDIDRQERERNHLALELHDGLLNQVALLSMYVNPDAAAPQFYEVFEKLTERFRETIHGLRPSMLNYGLGTALDDLVDELAERLGDPLNIQYQVPASQVRYPVKVEQHLFRIVQQATENALQHGAARTVRIYGTLEATEICLTVEDNGVGFQAGEKLDLAALLARKHFGLAGMFERAALIGAEIEINSTPEHGTQVNVRWCDQEESDE